jgi:heme iron utilization protein
MKINFDSALHLMHEAAWGSLATHSTQVPGYPFASILPFAPDEQHCPLFLVSSLAEHTKNLIADCRASFLVHRPGGQNVLTAERMSIVGDVQPVIPSPDLIARYLRYHPDAEEYLALGDFSFYRLVPERARYVAGFGQMGWVEKGEWAGAGVLSPADEGMLIQELTEVYPGAVRMLGIDCYGFDVEKNGIRERQRFPKVPIAVEQIGEVVRRFLAAM